VEAQLSDFRGSVGWYLITVIRDMESQGSVVCSRTNNQSFYSLA
jgi:hypothetical protein